MAILPGGAAAATGVIKTGDRIVAVAQGNGDPVETSGKTISQIVHMLRGPVGSLVRLTIRPPGSGDSPEHVVILARGNLGAFLVGRGSIKIGVPAPLIHGADVDGKEFKLSDYRGKVVMLDFWGDW